MIEVDVLPLLLVHVINLHILLVFHNDISFIIQGVTLIVQSLPLHHAVVLEINYPLWIEHVACRLECITCLGLHYTFDERGEQEDHVAAFVHDRSSTEGAGDFARKVVRDVFGGGVVPAKVMMAVGEIDVRFVEDGGPLEW